MTTPNRLASAILTGPESMERRQTLASAVNELELVAREIEDADGEVSSAAMERFANASLAVRDKVDAWINYIDAVKGMVVAHKEKRDRAERTYRAMQTLEKGLRQYVKYQLEAHPDVPFKGSQGALYLQKNPPALELEIKADPSSPVDGETVRDVTVRDVVDLGVLTANPDIRRFCKVVTYMVLDKEQIRAELKAGGKIPWAKMSQGSHVRIKA